MSRAPSFAVAIVCSLALALVAAGCGVTGAGECPSTLRPTPRSGVAVVAVPSTNQVYAFGGLTANGTSSDELWRWSYGPCGGWLPLAVPGAPRPDSDGAAVFDARRHRIIVAGGNGDLSMLDTDALAWTTTESVGLALGRRILAAFDATGDRLIDVTFGARVVSFANTPAGEAHFVSSPFGDTPPAGAALDPTRAAMFKLEGSGMHRFHLLTEAWSAVTVSGDVPPAGTQLAWDDARKRLLGIGDHLWAAELDASGTTAAWSLLPSLNAPPARDGAALAIDGDTLWLFGGHTAGCVRNDLWTLDLNGDTWQNLQPATTCP
jgi:hypothetical protein